jgi:hypothetical protein
MGAHTLGRVTSEGSEGFAGIWTPGQENVFNTTYYDLMISGSLRYVNKVNCNMKNKLQFRCYGKENKIIFKKERKKEKKYIFISFSECR